MSKLTESEQMKRDIGRIVKEGLDAAASKAPDCSECFNVERYVGGLSEEGKRNPKLASLLMRTREALENGAPGYRVFEDFGRELGKFSTGNKVVKGVINRMNETLASDGNVLKGLKVIDRIPDEYQRTVVKEAFDEYVDDPCDETRDALVECVQNLYGVDETLGANMMLVITEQAASAPEYFRSGTVDESKDAEIRRKLDEREKRRLKDDIFKKVERYLDERDSHAEAKRRMVSEKYSLDGIANGNGLNLLDRITAVLKSDAGRNKELRETLLQYTDALSHGAYEERLYETLLRNTSKYDYLVPVDRMRKAITEAVDKNRQPIELTKILEMMRDSSESYIYVELIQEDVARYVKDPTPTNRVQLQNALMPYAADAYVNEMFKIISADELRSSGSLTEKVLSLKDQLGIIRENASVQSIYSPVLYVKENESVFNVDGQYYVKKGNNVSVLDKKFIPKLDERFVELCHLVNDPKVDVMDDRIRLEGDELVADVYEGYVEINGYKEDKVSLRRLDEMCAKYENYDTNFYVMASCLLENFDDIAKIGWAKRVVLNSNPEVYADLFKLDENIFVTTHDDALMKHTFYVNVNPLFCRNLLNEHMGINVSGLFSDLLPNQDKILLQLNETKNEYEKSIEDYEKAIDDLEKAKDEATSDEIVKQLDDAIEDSKKKLDDVKSEYKQWQEETDKAVSADDDSDKDSESETDKDADGAAAADGGDETDGDTKKEVSNEPLEPDQVDDYETDFSTPLDQDGAGTDADASVEAQSEGGTEVPSEEITDDEFSGMLGDDSADASDDQDGAESPDAVGLDDAAPEDVFSLDSDDASDGEPDKDEFQTVDVDSIGVGPDGTPDASTGEPSDDDVFDDEPNADETPAEDVPSDEDIIIGDEDFGSDDDLDNGSAEDANLDIDTVDAETGEEPAAGETSGADTETAEDEPAAGAEATGEFGGDVNDPIGARSTVDAELYNPNIQSGEFNIVSVMFDGNAVDGTTMKSGSVLVLRPMVAADGRKYLETDDVHFYLNDEDGEPIVKADGDMSSAMYDSVKSAIKSHPDYQNVCKNGVAVAGFDTPTTPTGTDVDVDSDNWDGSAEDNGDVTIDDGADADELAGDVPDVIDTDDIDGGNGDIKLITTPGEDVDFDVDAEPDGTIDVTATTDDDSADMADTTDAPAGDEPDYSDDDFDFGDIFGDLDSDDDAPADPVQTETEPDGTEVEIPAAISDTTDSDAADADAAAAAADSAAADADADADAADAAANAADSEAAAADADADAADSDDDSDLDGLDPLSDDETDSDDSIPESAGSAKKRTKKQMNENRKAIVSIKRIRK